MSSLFCYRIGSLLAKGSVSLSEPERLQIEEHRSNCGRCRDNANFDEAVRSLAEAAAPQPRALRIDRAIRGAFAIPTKPSRPAARPRLLFAIGGAGVVAAALVALLIGTSGTDGNDEGLGAAQSEREPVHLDLGQGASVAHARVTATAATDYRWHQASRRIDLQRGALSVDVTPNTGNEFVVRTPEFDVLVLGTQFDVDLEGVRVQRGAVKVVSRDGRIIRERLTAGEKWSRDESEVASEVASGDGELDGDLVIDDDGDKVDDGVEVEVEDDEPPAARAKEPVKELLARAAAQIRSQSFAKAKRSIRAALAADPTRRQRAEAHTLLAELALVSGNLGEAITRYRRIAKRYRRYALGEAALFAAARLEAKRGGKSAARALLREYQERYPKGRFADEVARKLRALGPR